ncbi:MAG: VOC family protein [Acidimicrobiales bacterium]
MREPGDVFHLAIPAHDLDEAQHFYVTLLGCRLARRYEDRITLDFFGDQLVCHLTDAAERPPEPLRLYPRHFGVTFRAEQDFDALHELAVLRKVPFFRDVATRFEGRAEVHRTFVLRDPSDNLVEFKHYRDPRMMY